MLLYFSIIYSSSISLVFGGEDIVFGVEASPPPSPVDKTLSVWYMYLVIFNISLVQCTCMLKR